jgi:galactokinase
MPVLLSFQKDRDVRVEPVMPGGEFFMFFVDLAGHKDTVRILCDLQEGYARNAAIQRALGQSNEQIVRQAYSALKTGDAPRLGELMREAQRVFDESVAPQSPVELASPLLHEVLALKEIAGYIHGGKGVGSQGDGTAQMIARSRADREQAMVKIVRAFPRMRCFPLTIAPGIVKGAAVK